VPNRCPADDRGRAAPGRAFARDWTRSEADADQPWHGVVASLGLTLVLTKLVYEVNPTDPATFVGVSLILLLVALMACWLPARRAARVDPMEALRCE